MPTFLVAYLVTAAVFLVIDGLWLGVLARGFYQDQLSGVITQDIKLAWAAVFYLVYVVGIVFFAVRPALTSDAWQTALVAGALFGFFCYATYGVTNMATIKGWPLTMLVVDVVWGAALTAVSATVGFLLTRAISG